AAPAASRSKTVKAAATVPAARSPKDRALPSAVQPDPEKAPPRSAVQGRLRPIDLLSVNSFS
ncbi:hypothetical protein ABZ638_35940, partial [Streptomyces sp. NPDC007107]|uniref:hypothetical protein n=1 Tax=Streptomyces sp. NPDC007107 TaxID=3156915 RepID=UPI0033F5880E